MIKKAGKKWLIATLGMCTALTVSVGAATFGDNDEIPANAAEKEVEDIIDLSKGIKESVGQPNGDAAGNALNFHFKNVNMADGSYLEKLMGDYVVVSTASASKTVTQWTSDAGGTRAFRMAVYGGGMYLMCENNVLSVDSIQYVTFKKGFTLYEGTDGTDGDWVFTRTASTKVEGTEFPSDLKLYVNRTAGMYQYAAASLSIASAPAKTSYTTGDTFDPAGMTIAVATETNGTKTIAVSSAMCTADLSKAGEKTVTISYGGQTVTQNITVKDPAKILTGIAYKSGSISIEQNGTFGQMTLNDLKATATYEGGETKEISVTADMISVDPSEPGERKGKIVYAEGNTATTCDITVTVTERTSDYTAENMYVIPQDGYYAGENGANLKLNDSGISIWFTTNAGFGKETAFQGLTGGTDGWYDGDAFKAVYGEIKSHVLLNGKTFDELNAEGAGLARLCMGWFGEGQYCLRVHTDGTFRYSDLKTVTLLRGFQMYGNTGKALGAKTPCDYTFEVVDKPGTADKMPVRKTESISIVSAPAKTVYTKGDKFESNGMTVKAVYTDGGEKTFSVKDRMISYDFSEAGTKDVTVTYNGATVVQTVTVNEPVATITGIAVKDNAKLFLKQYSLTSELTPDAKIVVSYSDDTTEEIALTLDMISGYTNETTGDFKATVTYKGNTCEIGYTVAAYSGKSYFKGVNYAPIYGTEGTGYATLNGIDDITEGLKALWDVDKAQSLVIGKTNGDLVTINGVTLTQLVKEGKMARMLMYGKNFGFHSDDAAFMASLKNGAEICLLPGFAWVTNASDAWGKGTPETYVPIENAVITEPTYFCFKNGNVSKVIESIALNGTPKETYHQGDVIDVNGLTLSVKYKGFAAENVALTADMCDYDFASAGEKTVSVTYDGKTLTFNVTVQDVYLTGITIVSEPTKKTYDFAIDNELDLTGFAVKAIYNNGTEEEINIDSLTIRGFDSHAFGVQTITAVYGEFNATFDVEVKNVSDGKYLGIDYVSAATSFEGSQHNSLVISFTLNGMHEDLNSFWGADKLDYVADYMLINGKKVSDLIKEGKVTRLAVWTSQLVIHLDTNSLVPATWVDKRTDKNDPNDKGQHYVEGVSEVVKTVTFLPGFQWYTVNGVLAGDLWGNDNAYQYATPIPGAVLKETITIRNEDGYGWTRPLKTDGNNNIASDALTIVSLPNKTVYAPGERLELAGLQIKAKYEDGGEEIITVGASEIDGFKKDVTGKQTLSYTYFGQTVTFDITVEEPQPEKKKGCRGAIVSSAGVFALGVAALAFVFGKKENEE